MDSANYPFGGPVGRLAGRGSTGQDGFQSTEDKEEGRKTQNLQRAPSGLGLVKECFFTSIKGTVSNFFFSRSINIPFFSKKSLLDVSLFISDTFNFAE